MPSSGDSIIQKLNPQIGIHFAEAFRFAVSTINKNKTLLFGYQLEENIISTEIWSDAVWDMFGFYGEAAICASDPLNLFKVVLLTNSVSIPTLSLSGWHEHSSKTHSISSENEIYNFRVTPDDIYKIHALLALVRKLNWSIVNIISSSGNSGEKSAEMFLKYAPNYMICHEVEITIPDDASKSHYDDAIFSISVAKANGTILFTNMRDSIGLAIALNDSKLTKRFQILAATGFTNYVEVTKGNEEILEGSLSIEYPTNEILGFRDHFLALGYENRTGKEWVNFWEDTFECSHGDKGSDTKNCTGNEKLRPGKGYYPKTPVYLVIDLVYDFAFALRDIIQENCMNVAQNDFCSFHSKDLRKIKKSATAVSEAMKARLQNNSFPDYTLKFSNPITKHDPRLVKFDILNFVKTADSYENRKVGSWSTEREPTVNVYASQNEGVIHIDESRIRSRGNQRALRSSCRLACHNGEIRVYNQEENLKQCCWKCVKCGPNEISKSDSCTKCDNEERPDSQYKKCMKLELRYFSNDASSSNARFAYVGLSIAGIIATLFVFGIFIKFNDNLIVRASGRDLSYVLLAGICFLFLLPLAHFTIPTSAVCSLRGIGPGVAFCMCYSPLFLKTNRIYRIFRNAQTSIARPPLISPQSQLALLASIICVQIMLGLVWVLSNAPEVQRFVPTSREFVSLHCNNEALPIFLNLFLSFLFMSCCTWYAFKTRNFPKNYNESKYIGFTMYITCIVWAVSLPLYFMPSDDPSMYFTEHLICVGAIVIGFITLIGLFGQKVQILLLPTRQQQQGIECYRNEADPNKFQMKSHKLNTLSLQRNDSPEGLGCRRSTFSSDLLE